MAHEEASQEIAEHRATECIACSHRVCAVFTPATRCRQQRFRDLARGQRLDAGDLQGERLWVVVNGAVAISTSLPDGRRQIFGIETPGDLVCSMLTGEDDGCEVEALDTTRLCEIDLAASAIAAGGVETVIELLRQARARLTDSAMHIVCLGRMDAMERLCCFLADMARRTGAGERNVRVSLPMTREDIADFLGLNAETVSRVLSRIRKARLAVFLSPTEVMVPDIALLEERVPIGPWQRITAPPRPTRSPVHLREGVSP